MMINSDLEMTMTVKCFKTGLTTHFAQNQIHSFSSSREYLVFFKEAFSLLLPAQDYTREGGAIYHNASCIGLKVPERNQAACNSLRFETGQHSVDRRQRLRRNQDHGFRFEQSNGRGKLQSRSRYGSDVARSRHLLVSQHFSFFYSFNLVFFKRDAYNFPLDRQIISIFIRFFSLLSKRNLLVVVIGGF